MVNDENNKILVILGMHRSGTSLVSNWLHECGLHLGDHLYAASKHNKKGYFEDVDFLQTHKKLLELNGVHPSGHENPTEIDLNSEHTNVLYDLLIKKNKKYRQWGWKEPRTVLFTKTYKKLLKNTYYIIIFRNHDEVVNSLIKREKISKLKRNFLFNIKIKLFKRKWFNHYSKVWTLYNKILLENFNLNENCMFINYRRLSTNYAKVIDILNENGFDFRKKDFNEIYEDNLMSKIYYDSRLLTNKQKNEVKLITDLLAKKELK